MADPPLKLTPLIALPVSNVVAVLALPVNAPTNVVEVTEVNPAIIVAVAPKAMFVDPIVKLLLVNDPFGIFVNPAPEPAKPVAVRIPVLGTKLNLVSDRLAEVLPAAAVHKG